MDLSLETLPSSCFSCGSWLKSDYDHDHDHEHEHEHEHEWGWGEGSFQITGEILFQ
jgi:hypothetical protein